MCLNLIGSEVGLTIADLKLGDGENGCRGVVFGTHVCDFYKRSGKVNSFHREPQMPVKDQI